MRKISTGIENFKEFIDGHYYYIDKTQLIQYTLDDKVSLFTRPRRFGKTLNMSMLYYFYSNQEKENAYLFNNLHIFKDTGALIHQNQYPVIFLTLKDMKRGSMNQQIEKFASLISNIIRNFPELFDSPFLFDADKKLLNDYIYENVSLNKLQDALYNISLFLEKHYQKKVIILIDEYDVPLQDAYLNDYYDEMSLFMSNVFSAALKTNNSLERGVLTGCLRIAKESIFTGLNNFKVYSIFDENASECFGFTQDEMNTLLNYYHLNEYSHIIKNWYDGYIFGQLEIYNPWGTLMYIHKLIYSSDKDALSYRANTSSNSIVYNYIQKADDEMRKEFEILMQGKSIEKEILSELTYREMDDINNIYSFLLFTGYLKPIKKIKENKYDLMIPNKEIYQIYNQSFKKYFRDFSNTKRKDFVLSLKEGKEIEAQNILINILEKSISYYDNLESFYHGFMIDLLQGFKVKSNREAGNGRFDIAIIPNNILDTCVIIECKKADSIAKLKKESENAVQQIITQKYIEGMNADGYDNCIGYGISFYEKTCFITKIQKNSQ